MGLDGEWSGFYVQNVQDPYNPGDEGDPNHRFEISVHFEQREDGTLVGAMTDLRTGRVRKLAPAVESVKNRLKWGRRLSLTIRTALEPESTITTDLPSQSFLQGTVNGDEVLFLKHYVGRSTVAFNYRHRQEEFTHTNPPITYRGRLSPDGSTLRGRYEFSATIDQPGDVFELKRG
jgi:hypothetical protein